MKSYCITSEVDPTQILQTWHPDFILYRDKTTSNYATNAKKFVTLCKQTSPATKVFLHQDMALAHYLEVDGVHLTSRQLHQVEDAKKLDLEVIASTHSLDEIMQVELLGGDYVTYSPIFATPDKGAPKGVEKLAEAVMQSGIKIFALGGIVTQQQVDKVAKSGAWGFASIRYFELLDVDV